ncbi:hypothetical protein [Bacillus sp. UNC438CL73TsuS30]|uniref:hypothetical protein n=1 Tax=Bacillus sp. UNC438CL73TsuS30 TaxID=1340434 RepID=UPI000479286B|nr:hypothetical protein [Bacillus sp. UNC438CL73TsuS30]
MRKIFFTLYIVLAIFPSTTYSETRYKQFPPCTVILEPTKDIPANAKGVVLIYDIERSFKDKRTSLSVHALHMPKPSGFGDYNSYEVLAYIPNEISWIFPLTQYENNNWVGKWDEISSTMRPKHVKVRTINTKTKRVGPVILEKKVSCVN